MAYKSLQTFIEVLEKNNELIRIKETVSCHLEISEITDRFSKSPDGGKALLFENTGTEFPVLINAFGSVKRMELALQVNHLDEPSERIDELFKSLTSPKDNLLDKLKLLPNLSKLNAWMPKKIKGKGICQEVIHQEPNLDLLPILQTWPQDGGRFITLPMVNTIDPETGIRNIGMYRMQVLDAQSTGMHWHKHKVGARHYQAYKSQGKRMPIAVTLGGDPSYTYAATAPLPDNVDEYMLAGFLRQKKVELVKCISNDIYVPKDVDFVIEGYVDTEEDFIWEGPFGDHTGFYSLADWYPKFHVTCITHKKEAIYPTTIVGIPPMEDAYIGKATERIFLKPIQLTMLPEVMDLDLPFAGVAHNISLVKIDKTFSGQALKVMNSLWGAGQMMFNKILVVLNKEVDIHNYKAVLQAIHQNTNPQTDILFNRGPLDVLDHASSRFSFGSKIGIDATQKFEEEISDIHQSTPTHSELVNYEDINRDFESMGLIILSLNKEKYAFKDWLSKNESSLSSDLKWVVVIDHTIDVQHVFDVVWNCANHIDPIRDTQLVGNTLFIDGTKKNSKHDRFERDWPNPVVMDEQTIALVDKKWEDYQIGAFIPSPSNYYRKQMQGNQAVSLKKED